MNNGCMRRRCIAAVLSLLLIPVAASAQELTSDRPDFTESAVVVRRLQLEAGYTFARATSMSEHSIGEVLLRVPLLRRIELRLGAGSFLMTEPASPAEKVSGFDNPSVGAKFYLTENAAVITTVTLPTGSHELVDEDPSGEVLLSVSRDLSDRLSLGANTAIIHTTAGDGITELSGSLALGVGLTERQGAFFEAYGTRNVSGGTGHSAFLDFGVTHLVHDDLQLDARIGKGLSSGSGWYVGVGIVTRW